MPKLDSASAATRAKASRTSSAVAQACMPMPPPPPVALTITGSPIDSAAATASSALASSSVPASSGTPAALARARAVCFSPNAVIWSAVGPANAQAGLLHGTGEGGVLGEEAVAGVDDPGAVAERGLDDRVAAQIRLAGGRRTEADRVVGLADVRGGPVGVGEDGDGARPIRLAVRMMRRAISPRLATRTVAGRVTRRPPGCWSPAGAGASSGLIRRLLADPRRSSAAGWG